MAEPNFCSISAERRRSPENTNDSVVSLRNLKPIRRSRKSPKMKPCLPTNPLRPSFARWRRRKLKPQAERERLVQAVLRAMIPPDVTDGQNSVMEIRGGAGGDEANIFTGDLFMFRYAESKGGALKQSAPARLRPAVTVKLFSVTGEDAYKHLNSKAVFTGCNAYP